MRGVRLHVLAEEVHACQLACLDQSVLTVLTRDHQTVDEGRPLSVRLLAEGVPKHVLLPGHKVKPRNGCEVDSIVRRSREVRRVMRVAWSLRPLLQPIVYADIKIDSHYAPLSSRARRRAAISSTMLIFSSTTS